MKTFKGLPIYAINIDDEGTGMTRISLVDRPAVEKNFVCFSEEKEVEHFQFADEEKHIIFGLVCACDMPIYRLDSMGMGYYIVFTRDVIEKMVLKYSKENLWNSVSLQHDDNQIVESAIMVSFFIKDTAKGINPTGFETVSDGSLFASFKILDDTLWEEIKTSGKLNGFSLEIWSDLDENFSIEDNNNEPTMDEEVEELLK